MFIFGCDKTPTEGEPTTSDMGIAELENVILANKNNSLSSTADFDKIDLSRANAYFKEALSKDANNLDANLGAALCEILTLYADAEIRDAIRQWENSGSQSGSLQSPILRFGIPSGTKDMDMPLNYLGSNLLKIIKSAKTDPPTIAKMQDILKRKLAPRIDFAIARLAIIEKNQSFLFKITGKMQGDANLSPLYIDLTEIYLMDAMLQTMKSIMSMFFIFRFELASYQTADIVTALDQNNTSFFVLASDGQQWSQTSISSFLTGINKIRSGISFLKNETGNKSDHVIRIKTSNASGIDSTALNADLESLARIERYLTSTFSTEGWFWDSDLNPYTIDINLSAIFANPPQNPKKNWFPSYTVDTTATGDIVWHWTARDYQSFAFPDATLGGLLPGMTSEKLKRIFLLDEEFGYYLECHFSQYQYPYSSAIRTARLEVNGISYQPKPERSETADCHFLITDVVGTQGTVYATLHTGAEVKIVTNVPINIRSKTHENLYVSLNVAPTTLTAQLSSTIPRYVTLTIGDWQGYNIERSLVTLGGFTPLASMYGNSYNDKTVSSGTTYRYRLMPFGYYSWSFPGQISGGIENNYSNIVTVTIP
jgi:hypothetical protein